MFEIRAPGATTKLLKEPTGADSKLMIDEANRPIAMQLQRHCCSTLQWLISFSLGLYMRPHKLTMMLGILGVIGLVAAYETTTRLVSDARRKREKTGPNINQLSALGSLGPALRYFPVGRLDLPLAFLVAGLLACLAGAGWSFLSRKYSRNFL